MDHDPLRVVGWGPLPLPGERKRMAALRTKYGCWKPDPDLVAKHEQHVQRLLDARDELLDQRRHRSITLEVIEQELRGLGIAF